ncbi:hypothetical protein NEDG_01460 [Nematocida displodere]|uniref:Nas2 N-terminal domain-containing protein n=1 Tax=Nematocida displodere TaxID=1805483 RepID=A0A177ED77_9MICR|nr:hypothetical protein NEDG_01460 [Nematocida displodere]
MDIKDRIDHLKTLEQKMSNIITTLKEDFSYEPGEPLIDQEGFPRGDIDVYTITQHIKEYKKIQSEWRPLREEIEQEAARKYSTE